MAITEWVKRRDGNANEDERFLTRLDLTSIGAIGVDRGSLFRKPIDEPTPIENREPAINAPANQFNAALVFDATAGKAVGTHDLALTLPVGGYVTFGWIDVETTFTSATDAATIGIGVAVDDPSGIVAPIAISNATNPWDVGTKPTIQTGSALNFTIRATDTRAIIVTVGSEALTAGKFTLNVYYSTSG